jgi:hypothetical protein
LNPLAIIKAISRRLIHKRAPKLSDILERPTWQEHPLTERCGLDQAWYVLLVPTDREGQHVRSDVIRALRNQQADFTVVVGYFHDDTTAPDILAAAELDVRIRPLRVEAKAGDWEAMSAGLRAELLQLEAERGRKPHDSLCVPLPELIIRR